MNSDAKYDTPNRATASPIELATHDTKVHISYMAPDEGDESDNDDDGASHHTLDPLVDGILIEVELAKNAGEGFGIGFGGAKHDRQGQKYGFGIYVRKIV